MSTCVNRMTAHGHKLLQRACVMALRINATYLAADSKRDQRLERIAQKMEASAQRKKTARLHELRRVGRAALLMDEEFFGQFFEMSADNDCCCHRATAEPKVHILNQRIANDVEVEVEVVLELELEVNPPPRPQNVYPGVQMLTGCSIGPGGYRFWGGIAFGL